MTRVFKDVKIELLVCGFLPCAIVYLFYFGILQSAMCLTRRGLAARTNRQFRRTIRPWYPPSKAALTQSTRSWEQTVSVCPHVTLHSTPPRPTRTCRIIADKSVYWYHRSTTVLKMVNISQACSRMEDLSWAIYSAGITNISFSSLFHRDLEC